MRELLLAMGFLVLGTVVSKLFSGPLCFEAWFLE